jgi:hypothetical protein
MPKIYQMKELKINVPKGYEIDKDKSTFENIVFKEINVLPSSWENLGLIQGFYVNGVSKVEFYGVVKIAYTNKNTFKTEEQAEASIALAQLSQLRDVYRQGWEPDWLNNNSSKYCIYIHSDSISTVGLTYTTHFLSFKDKETADLFLENFRDLIEKAKPLMS